MAEVIARVRRELQDRLNEIEAELAGVEALIAERARLEHALATPPFAAVERPQRTARVAAPRAPRGANRAAVLAALETMPGATVAELASASRVGRQQTYALLRAGVERGEVRAVALAGGQTGYRAAAEPETAFPAAPPTPVAEPLALEPVAESLALEPVAESLALEPVAESSEER